MRAAYCVFVVCLWLCAVVIGIACVFVCVNVWLFDRLRVVVCCALLAAWSALLFGGSRCGRACCVLLVVLVVLVQMLA